VIVDVDESGRKVQTTGVNHRTGGFLLRSHGPTSTGTNVLHRRYPARPYPHVSLESRTPRSVDHHGVTNEDVVHAASIHPSRSFRTRARAANSPYLAFGAIIPLIPGLTGVFDGTRAGFFISAARSFTHT
jgi:hypothetical protein